MSTARNTFVLLPMLTTIFLRFLNVKSEFTSKTWALIMLLFLMYFIGLAILIISNLVWLFAIVVIWLTVGFPWVLTTGYGVAVAIASLIVTLLTTCLDEIPTVGAAIVQFVISCDRSYEDHFRQQAAVWLDTLRNDVQFGYKTNIGPVEIDGKQYTIDNINILEDITIVYYVLISFHYETHNMSRVRAWTWLTMLIFLFVFDSVLKMIATSLRMTFATTKWIMRMILIILLLDNKTVNLLNNALEMIIHFILRLLGGAMSVKITVWSRYFKVLLFAITLRLLNLWLLLLIVFKRHRGGMKQWLKQSRGFVSLWKTSIQQLQTTIDTIQVPEFIRELPSRFDVEAINESNEIYESLGWPETVKADNNINQLSWMPESQWILGHLNFESGFRNIKVFVERELETLRKTAPLYYRTEEWGNVDLELQSLSRYFKRVDYDFPDLPIDEAWVVLSDIFEKSKLTPFSYIIQKWEKKFALGPLWRDPSRKFHKKLSRRNFIKQIGGIPNLIKLWSETFKHANRLVPVNGVSIKLEARNQSKYLKKALRTVISAPLGHYIASSLWNYAANHNYKWKTSPIKIGIPINGFNFAKLFMEHSRYDVHFAGDFSDFDSTLSGKILDVIKGVRKKGFETHKDYEKIAWLIEANYKNLIPSPLATTTTGNVYHKGLGLSTGHSSTSMDNSVACVVIYLMAWKHLTGLSAHEFKYYNKLSNYGDDHVISWDLTAPTIWTKENIMKVCKSWGLTLRDEAPSGKLTDMAFLSKRCRPLTTAEEMLFRKLGLDIPAFAIYHERDKLVGKMCAPVRSNDRYYRVKRLISYMYLTAHHEDVYQEIARAITRILPDEHKRLPWPVPSYEEVITMWYSPTKSYKAFDNPEELIGSDMIPEEIASANDEYVVHDYEARLIMQIFASLLSIVPDVINPVIFNVGYVEYIYKKASPLMRWPIEMLAHANNINSYGQMTSIISKTPYSFLGGTSNLFTNFQTSSKHYFRHYLYMCLHAKNEGLFINAVFAWLTNLVHRMNFIINGKVATYTGRIQPSFYNMFLVVFLNWVPDYEIPHWMQISSLPDPTLIIDQLIGIAVAWFWSSVPANFKNVDAVIDQIDNIQDKAVRLQAGTGTGKSTTFIAHLWNKEQAKYQRIIVIEPRRLLVLGIPQYVNNAFNLDAHSVTEGYPYNNNMRLIYTTPVEVMLHPDWLTENNLFVVDEAHVFEPAYRFIKHMLRVNQNRRVLMTATMPQDLQDGVLVDVGLARVYNIEDVNVVVPQTLRSYREVMRWYITYVTDFVNSSHPSLKFLIFVIDKVDLFTVNSGIQRKCCQIDSDNSTIDASAKVVIATSVADVGVTIPNVDYVISLDIFRQVLDKGFGDVHNNIVKLPDETRIQRRGRTGRTANGTFVYCVSNIENIRGQMPIGFDDIGAELLKCGVKPSFINKYLPTFSQAITRKYLANADEGLRTLMIDNFDTMLDELSKGSGITSLIDDQKNVLFVSHTNTFLSGTVDDEGNACRLTGNQMYKFLCFAATYAACKGRRLTLNNAREFFRQASGIHGKEFKKFMRTGIFDIETQEIQWDDHARYSSGQAMPGEYHWSAPVFVQYDPVPDWDATLGL